jgi:hypothetical protein
MGFSAQTYGEDSKILTTLPACLKEFAGKRWQLIYRGSRDGFGVSDFHKKCDGHANTVTVIETTKGFVFGGYTPLTWKSGGHDNSDLMEKTFLFTVVNPHMIEPQKFPLRGSRAIYCNSKSGPTFGFSPDLSVSDYCNSNAKSFTNIGFGFTNRTAIDGRQVFTGEQYFTVKEIEIFTISEGGNSE